MEEQDKILEDLKDTLITIRMICAKQGDHDFGKLLNIYETCGKTLDKAGARHLISDIRSRLK